MQNQHNTTSSSSSPTTPEPIGFETPPALRKQARTEASIELPADELIVKSLATEWQYVKFSKICDKHQELLGTSGSKARRQAQNRRKYVKAIQTKDPEK
jgi:hypothetical protein